MYLRSRKLPNSMETRGKKTVGTSDSNITESMHVLSEEVSKGDKHSRTETFDMEKLMQYMATLTEGLQSSFREEIKSNSQGLQNIFREEIKSNSQELQSSFREEIQSSSEELDRKSVV